MVNVYGRKKYHCIIGKLQNQGRVYFVVKTMLEAATERKRRHAKKNFVKVRPNRKAPKGRKDAERTKNRNNLIFNPFSGFSVGTKSAAVFL